MADLVTDAGGAVRAADTLLRMAGGRAVLLRVPAPAVPGSVAEQVGLGTPGFEDMELGPAVFRKARAKLGVGEAPRYEAIVSASAVEAVVGSLGFESVSVLFGVAAGVVVDGRLMFVESATASQVFGEVYCYRLGLRGPVGLMV